MNAPGTRQVAIVRITAQALLALFERLDGTHTFVLDGLPPGCRPVSVYADWFNDTVEIKVEGPALDQVLDGQPYPVLDVSIAAVPVSVDLPLLVTER